MHHGEENPMGEERSSEFGPTEGLLLALYALCVVACVYHVSCAWAQLPFLPIVFILSTLPFTALSLLHAYCRLGGWQTGAFFAITFVGGMISELIGVRTGRIFGAYSYSDQMGWRLLGFVPVIVPLAWFMISYTSYTLVNSILACRNGVVVGRSHARRARVRQAIGYSALGALATTAWDLGMEHQLVASGLWIWEQDGSFFGIPVVNFIGWITTSLILQLAFRLYEIRFSPHRSGLPEARFVDLPVAVYALVWLTTTLVSMSHDHSGPAWVGFFAMGSFVFAATMVKRIRAGQLVREAQHHSETPSQLRVPVSCTKPLTGQDP